MGAIEEYRKNVLMAAGHPWTTMSFSTATQKQNATEKFEFNEQ